MNGNLCGGKEHFNPQRPKHPSSRETVDRLGVEVYLSPSDTSFIVPTGSPSRGGDVAVYACHKPTELAHSFFFYSVLVSDSVFVALSTVFHIINSPNNSPLSHSVLPVLFLTHWSFQLDISL